MNTKMVIENKERELCIKSYILNNKYIDLEEHYTEAHKFYKRLYWNRTDLYDIIPSTKHTEYIDRLEASIESLELSSHDNHVYEIYENRVVPLFESIENNLLYTKENPERTKYNLFTTTGRPSNSNGGINYAALNKEDGTRRRFISRHDNGLLVEMDFDAYHIRLIADLIKYKLPSTSVHEYFAKKFYGIENVTQKEYRNSKAMSFQVLYGGVPKELESIEYFHKTKQYISNLWDTYINKGYIKTPIFNRRLYKNNFENMNPQKLFNYLIQAFETERNIIVMEEIQKELAGKFSKLILYTYDAFLFDINKEESSIIPLLKEKMKFPVKVHYGKNYDNMNLLEV